MIWHTHIDDETGTATHEVDAEGIDWFIKGLEQLKHCDVGEEISTPAFIYEEDGSIKSVGETILKRVADPPPDHPDYSESI